MTEYSDWLTREIKFVMNLFHKGKKKAIKIRDLLLHLQNFNDDRTTEREMRQAYEDLPICGGREGLYLPETKAEIDEQISLHMKKTYSYFRKIKILRNYKIESDSVQKNLF